MSILPGLIVEGLILIVAANFGTVIAGKSVLADLAEKSLRIDHCSPWHGTGQGSDAFAGGDDASCRIGNGWIADRPIRLGHRPQHARRSSGKAVHQGFSRQRIVFVADIVQGDRRWLSWSLAGQGWHQCLESGNCSRRSRVLHRVGFWRSYDRRQRSQQLGG